MILGEYHIYRLHKANQHQGAVLLKTVYGFEELLSPDDHLHL